MTDDKLAHCNCGYEASGSDEAELVSEIRLHALTAHGIAFSLEDALLVVLRSQLECGVADVSRRSPGRRHTRGGEG
jgi:predicted small metal-binding protein